jgi:ATP-dependent Lhr-like helicase
MYYELLSEPIRRYIRDKRWESLRPIQAAAIVKILSTENNYILASHTASGKTEAAFLPILSKVDFNERGVQVLYISPLIALINDQFFRVEELCKYLDVTVTRWHGEASKSLKEKLVNNPSGIVLITPESLEAMFSNKPYHIAALFGNLKFIVIDEIHHFIGTERGTHLKSLIARIKQKARLPIRTIGLSATIGDYDEAKKFTGEESKTKVLLDKTTKVVHAEFRFIKAEGANIPMELIEDLYEQTKNKKVLIFPNARTYVEEIATRLKNMAEKRKGHQNYFSHHSSIDKALREHIEDFAKNNNGQHFCIVCTSTLELGIDIGAVDLIVQVNSTFSIASLIQRVGRSGRTEGTRSNLLLYATREWSLLQSAACWELYKEGFIEPPESQARPFDVLFHQVLSVLKERSGLSRVALLDWIKDNAAFSGIGREEADLLIGYMINKEYIEDLRRELIVGVEGEVLTTGRGFYTVFQADENMRVVHAGKVLGDIPFSPQLMTFQNIFLAAKIWEIVYIDLDARRVEVIPANNGRRPFFFGNPADIHPRIRRKMLQLLCRDIHINEMDENSAKAIDDIKQLFHGIAIEDLDYDRPVLQDGSLLQWYTFNGTRVNRTILFLLKSKKIEVKYNEEMSLFEFQAGEGVLEKMIKRITIKADAFESLVNRMAEKEVKAFWFPKWGEYLSVELKRAYLMENYFDPAGTLTFLNNLRTKYRL